MPTGGNRKGNIEMYSDARYFTVTGKCYQGSVDYVSTDNGGIVTWDDDGRMLRNGKPVDSPERKKKLYGIDAETPEQRRRREDWELLKRLAED
jgi:primase-polymerase (primpol)-like protein